MVPAPKSTRRHWPAAVVLAVTLVATAACSSSSASSTPSTGPQGAGPVDVLYAGSLVGMMEQGIGPAFDGSTGYTFNGYSGGSDTLASEIKGGTQVADIFVSASPPVNEKLMGAADGDWVSWYATFASSPLVLGYNASSPFAAQLKTKPWYDVVAQSGFTLGRTDPATDPKGKLADEALDEAASAHGEPALASLAGGTAGVYPEQTLVGRLQAGQLDAGFFYASEAATAGIPTVPLGGTPRSAEYTVTVVNRAPHAAAAHAFVKFLLGTVGRSILSHGGLTLIRPAQVTGAGHVPKELGAVLRQH